MKAIDFLKKVAQNTTIIIRVEMLGMRFESRRDVRFLIKDYNDESKKDVKALLDREVSKIYPHDDLALTLDLQ